MMAAVWSDPKLLIGDGLHPNPAGVAKMVAGVAKMVEIVAPPVEKLLTARRAGDVAAPQAR
jgi:lysophospholipase L1-like esterase